MTPNSRNELLGLAERVEGATGPDRELNYQIAKALGFVRETDKGPLFLHNGPPGSWSSPRYTSSLDVAMSLKPEGWQVWAINESDGGWWTGLRKGHVTEGGWAPTPTAALALTAACLRAIAEGVGGQHE